MAQITGTLGNNVLTGTIFRDTIEGLGGDDTIDGRGRRRHTEGGTGNDRSTAATARTLIEGGDSGRR